MCLFLLRSAEGPAEEDAAAEDPAAAAAAEDPAAAAAARSARSCNTLSRSAFFFRHLLHKSLSEATCGHHQPPFQLKCTRAKPEDPKSKSPNAACIATGTPTETSPIPRNSRHHQGAGGNIRIRCQSRANRRFNKNLQRSEVLPKARTKRSTTKATKEKPENKESLILQTLSRANGTPARAREKYFADQDARTREDITAKR
jgi:hypothetical protein